VVMKWKPCPIGFAVCAPKTSECRERLLQNSGYLSYAPTEHLLDMMREICYLAHPTKNYATLPSMDG
jgi:hypothetical protein